MASAVIAVVLYAAAAYEAGVLVYLAIAAATYYYMESQKSDDKTASLAKKHQTTTVRSASASKKIIYGQTQVGGVLAYLGSSGTDNEYAHMVVVMAPHEVEEISTIWFDDKLATDFSSSYYRIKKHLGASDQVADADLIAEVAELNSNFRLRGLAYVYVRFKFDRDIWPNGLPRTIKALIKGKKVYDPRDVAQSPTDGSTWTWSDNWGLVMRDYAVHRLGMQCVDSEIDESNVIAAANVSEEQVIKYDGTYQDRYTVNGVVDTGDSLAANRDSIAASGGGYAPWVEGMLKIVPGVYSPAVSRGITDDDLRDSITIRPRTPRQDLFNAIKGVYLSPADGYKITEFPPVTNSFYETQDGEQIFTDVEYQFCDDPDRAQRLAKLNLDRARQPIVINFPGKWSCFGYTLGDTVEVTLTAGHESPIWDAKEFKIIEWSLAPEGDGVDMVLREESSASYDWNQGDAVWYDTAPDTALPSIFTPPPNVINVSFSEEVYDFRLVSKTRLTVNFDPPTGYPYFKEVEVQHSTDGVNYKHLANQSSSFTIDPVSEGETHYFILRSISTMDVKGDLSTAYLATHTVEGQTSAPASIAALNAIVNSNTVNLWAVKLNDPDVEVYEFRMGAFNTGIFLASERSPNISMYGVKPGSHTFSCNTLSTNGKYGDNPQQAYAFLSAPPGGWTVAATQSYDYSTGTHLNTEATTYDFLPYLKCSHTADPVVNGGFETGDLTGWSAIGTPGGGESISVVATSAATLNFLSIAARGVLGGASAEDTAILAVSYGFLGSDATSSSYFLQIVGAGSLQLGEEQDVVVVPGHVYTLSGYIRISALTAGAAFIEAREGVSGALIGTGLTQTVVTGDFVHFTETITIPDGVEYVTIQSYAEDATALGITCMFDSISLTKAEPLSGRYITPIYDATTVAERLFYALADIVVTGSGTTWNSKFGAGLTWNQLLLGELNWRQIFELSEAPKIEMALIYGETTPPTSRAEKMEILSTVVTARYYQLEINITDPIAGMNALVEEVSINMATRT